MDSESHSNNFLPSVSKETCAVCGDDSDAIHFGQRTCRLDFIFNHFILKIITEHVQHSSVELLVRIDDIYADRMGNVKSRKVNE